MGKIFDKYRTKSPDYHYKELDIKSIRKYNLPLKARYLNLVEEVVKETDNRALKLLDVGCGDGVVLWLLHKRLPKIALYGIEPDERALAVAREKVSAADLRSGLADSLPYESNSFDLIISSDVIEHVPDPGKMLAEIKRVAKDGATIIVGTPIRHSKFPLDHNHEQEWFPEDFLELVGTHFRNTKLIESHNLIPTLIYSMPPQSSLNFKYIMNLLSLTFGWNPFLSGRKNKMQMFAYMTVTCKK